MSKTATYIAARRIQERYGVSTRTIRNWENEGKIEAKRTLGGKRLYNSNDIDQLFGAKELSKHKSKISYARVNTGEQKGDLKRLVQGLRKA
jgi:predicted site-specific integrase-resolvase